MSFSALWMVLFGLIITIAILAIMLLIHLQRKRIGVDSILPVYTAENAVTGVLQNLQALMVQMAPGAAQGQRGPTLADVVTVLEHFQADFGRKAPLEAVIQRTVLQDLLRQYRLRVRRRATVPRPALLPSTLSAGQIASQAQKVAPEQPVTQEVHA